MKNEEEKTQNIELRFLSSRFRLLLSSLFRINPKKLLFFGCTCCGLGRWAAGNAPLLVGVG
jgi:hypothetical protein